MKILRIDLEGDIVLNDGRYVNPRTGKASRKDYVRTNNDIGQGVETWKDADITAEDLEKLALLFVEFKKAEADKVAAENAEREAARAAEKQTPEYQAKRADAIRSVRRFFTTKEAPEEIIPNYINMSYDKFDIEIALWPEYQ